MRVIAGTARSMPLRTVKGMDVRPTTDRTKETLFNIIQFRIPGCRFLDLYAGSGSIGIEALSRGAGEAVFVEKSRASWQLVEENLKFTKLFPRAKIIKGDVQSVVPELDEKNPFDIIFMDPPFRMGLERETLSCLSEKKILAENGLIIVEAAPRTDFSYLGDMGFEITREKIYGMSEHIFIKPKD